MEGKDYDPAADIAALNRRIEKVRGQANTNAAAIESIRQLSHSAASLAETLDDDTKGHTRSITVLSERADNVYSMAETNRQMIGQLQTELGQARLEIHSLRSEVAALQPIEPTPLPEMPTDIKDAAEAAAGGPVNLFTGEPLLESEVQEVGEESSFEVVERVRRKPLPDFSEPSPVRLEAAPDDSQCDGCGDDLSTVRITPLWVDLCEKCRVTLTDQLLVWAKVEG